MPASQFDRRHTCQQFIKNNSQRVDVRPDVDVLTRGKRLLRAHILGCSDQCPYPREHGVRRQFLA